MHIPKLVDGRGKLFFFAQLSRTSTTPSPDKNQGTSTVPANEKHLQGDFSDMLRLPNPNQYIIYDPLTARPDPHNPNRMIRTAFPNNIIPRDRIFNPDGSYKNPLFGLYAAAWCRRRTRTSSRTDSSRPATTTGAPSPTSP